MLVVSSSPSVRFTGSGGMNRVIERLHRLSESPVCQPSRVDLESELENRLAALGSVGLRLGSNGHQVIRYPSYLNGPVTAEGTRLAQAHPHGSWQIHPVNAPRRALPPSSDSGSVSQTNIGENTIVDAPNGS